MTNDIVRRRGWRRLFFCLVAVLALMLIVGELVARFGFGLADPPLYMADPNIEYLSKPNQDCRYLGNLLIYNEWSMRSGPMAREKSRLDEIRVLIVGDSVVAGGVKIDQGELATELLRSILEDSLGRPVAVGNVAAAGWGPPNQLAYLRRYGFFNADCVVFVLSSGDYGDAPNGETKVGVDPAFPAEKPLFALAALVERVISNRERSARRDERQSQERAADPADVARALGALSEMLDLAREHVPVVLAAIHLQQREAVGDVQPGNAEIRHALAAKNVPVIELGPQFVQALEAGESPYFDWIHPSPLGHRLIGEQLSEPIRQAISERETD